MTQRFLAWHGTGVGDIEDFETRPEGTHCSKVGAWFSAEPLVADLFARLAGEYDKTEPEPMWVYQVELTFERPRVYLRYHDFEMDVAMNPLVDDGIYDYDAYCAWAEETGREMPETPNRIAAFRAHLEQLGYDAIVISHCIRDGGLPRSDYVAFDPRQIRVLEVASLPPSGLEKPDVPDLIRRMKAEAEARQRAADMDVFKMKSGLRTSRPAPVAAGACVP